MGWRLKTKKFILSCTTVFLIMMGCSYPESYFNKDVSWSPDGQHRIEIIGDQGQPKVPLIESKVRAEIYSKTKLLGSTKISFADFLDPGFVNKYGVYGWENNNVFGFRDVDAPKDYSKNDGDVLTVLNKSGKTISYININFTKYYRFIFVSLAPNQSASVAKHESNGLAYIYQEGRFSDGEEIGRSGVGFSEETEDVEEWSLPYRFCVVIYDDKVTITSNKLSGKTDDSDTIVVADEVCGLS